MRTRISILAIASSLCLIGVAGTAGAADIDGTNDPDTLFGTNDTDTIDGLLGDDEVFARGGNDEITTGDGFEEVMLGSGQDSVTVVDDADDGGLATILDDDGTAGDEIVNGEGQSTIFSADGAPDSIDCGGTTTDIVYDVVFADLEDSVTNCELVLNVDGETIDEFGAVLYRAGTKKADKITVTAVDDIEITVVFGKRGNDKLTVKDTNALVFGGAGKDKMKVKMSQDAVNFFEGTMFDDDGKPGDVLTGGAGHDTFYSADGAKDKITCGAGFDEVIADDIDVITDVGNCENLTQNP